MTAEDESHRFPLTDEDLASLSRLLAMAHHILETAQLSENRTFLPELSQRHFSKFDFNFSMARYIFKLRRHRYRYFPINLFAEPAWDMLLMLYGMPGNGPARAKELALGCQVAFTTALRWQAVLESQGMIERTPHRNDARVTEVRLTKKGKDKLDAYFSSLRGLMTDASAPPQDFANDL